MHVHLFNIFGSKRVRRLSKLEVFDPSDYFAVKSADVSIISHPKAFYGVYLSSLYHTHKLKLPKKLLVFLALFVFAAFFLYYTFTHFASYADPDSQLDLSSSVSVQPLSFDPNQRSFTLDRSQLASLFGCVDLQYTGHDYQNNELEIFINCVLPEEPESYTFPTGEDSESFTYTHPRTKLLDAYLLAAYGVSFDFDKGRLFLVYQDSKFFLTRLF
jgi:hypothetical protein